MKVNRQPRPRSPRARRCIANCVEQMESRLLLSAVTHHPVKHATLLKKLLGGLPASIDPVAAPRIVVKGAKPASVYGTTSPTGNITPAQMVGAYLGSSFNFDGVTGDGTGQTIAIVDAFDDPGMVNTTASNFSTSDLAQFDAAYHLPNPPSFTKYGVTDVGGAFYQVSTTLPGTASPYTGGSVTWEMEESLDVEWAHVMAPMANIALIEVDGTSDLLNGVQAADMLSGVSVVSMSWAFNEASLGSYNTESSYDSTYFGNSGITYVAATGDTGADASGFAPYPAASKNVVAVGGTSLTVSGNSWSSESTWANSSTSGSGGGRSLFNNSTPAYQSAVNSSTYREFPDISLDGNPNTGVAIYDSFDFGATTPWFVDLFGGTSLSAPLMAGLVAVSDQGRALDSLKPLNSNGVTGGTDIHTLLYSLAGNSSSYAADFHDITTGNPTGTAGPPPNFSPEVGYDLASGLGTPVANNLDFDLSGISSTLAVNQPAVTSLYFKTDPTIATDLDEWVNSSTPGTGTPTYKFVAADISSFVYNANSESFTLINSSGTAIGSSSTLTITTPANTAFSVANSYLSGFTTADFGPTSINFFALSTLNLNPAGTGNSLTVNGTGGNDGFTVTSTSVQLNSLLINLTNLSDPILNTGTGIVALSVNSGIATVASQASGGILTRNFSSISVASGANLLFSTAVLHTNRTLIETGSLTDAGQLDLGGNDLIVHNGNLAAITALLTAGYAGGQWNGKGIDSAAANANASHLTALGSIQNTVYGGSGQPTFDGISPVATDVLIKYTWYGDANLDGKVDGSDYSRIDAAFASGGTGWFNGDFNYSSSVNGSDYTLIDNAFNTQGTGL